jgi:hypothetical protein
MKPVPMVKSAPHCPRWKTAGSGVCARSVEAERLATAAASTMWVWWRRTFASGVGIEGR